MSRISFFLAVVAAVLAAGVANPRPAQAEDTTDWPAWPDTPSDLPAEGPCGGVGCQVILPLTYNRLKNHSTTTVTYTPVAGSPSESKSVMSRATYSWMPSALCAHVDASGGNANNHHQPCPCSFENLPVYSVTFARSVTVRKIYKKKITYVTGSIPGVPASPSYQRERVEEIYVGDAIDIGPWVTVASGKYAVNCCVCTHHPAEVVFLEPGYDPIPPLPGSGGTTPTTDSGDLPSDVSAPGNWPMPTRCTNPACVSFGTVKYSSSNSLGGPDVTQEVWDPTGGPDRNGWSFNTTTMSWDPVMKNLTKKAYTTLTATWTVEVPKEVKCETAQGPNHGGTQGGHVTSPNHCTGTCEFEAIPQGTATRTWSRGYTTEPVLMEISAPGQVTSLGVTAGSRHEVKVDFVIKYIMPWTQGASTSWSGTPISRCKCVNVPGPAVTEYDDLSAADIERMKKEQEKNKTDRPPPVTTPR